jgi:hypothetical protein
MSISMINVIFGPASTMLVMTLYALRADGNSSFHGFSGAEALPFLKPLNILNLST